MSGPCLLWGRDAFKWCKERASSLSLGLDEDNLVIDGDIAGVGLRLMMTSLREALGLALMSSLAVRRE